MRTVKIFLVAIALSFTTLSTSCVSTRVEASPYQDTFENLECQSQSSWSYWWGLKQKRIDVNPGTEGVICPCAESSLSWVGVKSSLTDLLLSLATVGIVNHRTVTYGCSRPSNGEVDLDN
ncbi:hypothetical protein LB467_03180 [Salegentibacter sp. JZCK2]|uniref:hypothetical protein n=1 Tax=Salegentibacter tibetensis TaxID=2873600 RepID=UPI001CCA9584|nr:hypothetical protein [Salegentibacter tibetensis]MBZ9728678.1 hypothetical protein [Salegentibacter tibetensis]